MKKIYLILAGILIAGFLCAETITGERVFYIAPDGDDEAEGTIEDPFATINKMLQILEPGDVFVMRGGTYYYEQTITVIRNTHNGTAEKPITLMAYPGEIPVLDFWAQEELAGRDGLRINASYWHVKGIHLTGAGGNGFRIHGSHNILENCVAFRNRLSGFHLEDRINPIFPDFERASYNLIKNCDSFHNFNWRNRVGNMADGFAAKYDIGPGNKFYGCRSWGNSDDGFDFWQATETVIVEKCWAYGNGDRAVFEEIFQDDPELMAKLLAEFDGGGNGFKLGGDNYPGPHIVTRSLAFDNKGKGFDHNNNTGALTLIHNTAYNNDRNFVFPRNPNEGQSVFKNNVSAKSRVIAEMPSNAIVEGNSWQSGTTVTDDVFVSVNTELAYTDRQEDGSLPELSLLRPTPESFMINGGVVVEEPYYGSAPDMGAYEYDDGGELTVPDIPNSFQNPQALSVEVFPNPVSNGMVTVRLNNAYTTGMVSTMDMNGILLNQQPLSGQSSTTIHMNYAPGIYLLHITNHELNIVQKVIVK